MSPNVVRPEWHQVDRLRTLNRLIGKESTGSMFVVGASKAGEWAHLPQHVWPSLQCV
jgi:hypothetical protein